MHIPITNNTEGAGTGVEERPRQQAESVSATIAGKAREAATFIGNKAERATEAMGAGMESLGGAIRDREPTAAMLHNAGETVANKLEGGGQYLEQHGLKGIGDDVTDLIRRNPIPALLIGVGVGILIARIAGGEIMAVDIEAESETKVSTLVGGIVLDARRLFMEQLTLFQVELKHDINRAMQAFMPLLAGMMVMTPSVVLLAQPLPSPETRCSPRCRCGPRSRLSAAELA